MLLLAVDVTQRLLTIKNAWALLPLMYFIRYLCCSNTSVYLTHVQFAN